MFILFAPLTSAFELRIARIYSLVLRFIVDGQFFTVLRSARLCVEASRSNRQIRDTADVIRRGDSPKYRALGFFRGRILWLILISMMLKPKVCLDPKCNLSQINSLNFF